MICQQIQRSLSAYVDRQLPAWEKAEVSAHADSCPVCQTEIAALLDLKRALRAHTLPGLPADSRTAIELATVLKKTSAWSWLKARWWIPTMSFAAAGAAAWLMTHSSPVDPATRWIQTLIVKQKAQPHTPPSNITAWHRDAAAPALPQTHEQN